MKDNIVKFEQMPKTIIEIDYEKIAEAREISLRVHRCMELFIKKTPILKLVRTLRSA